MITTAELCDRCSAVAHVIVVLPLDAGKPDFLTLCRHHADYHNAALMAVQARVMPMSALEALELETKKLEAA